VGVIWVDVVVCVSILANSVEAWIEDAIEIEFEVGKQHGGTQGYRSVMVSDGSFYGTSCSAVVAAALAAGSSVPAAGLLLQYRNDE
jgi:hypothetical protein